MNRPEVREKVKREKVRRGQNPYRPDEETRKRIAEGVKASWERRRREQGLTVKKDKPKPKPKPKTKPKVVVKTTTTTSKATRQVQVTVANGRSSKSEKASTTLRHSDEHRQKIAEAIRKKWEDPEYRAKLTATKKSMPAKRTTRMSAPSPPPTSPPTPTPTPTPTPATTPATTMTPNEKHVARMAEAWRKVAEAEARLAKLEAQVPMVRSGHGAFDRLNTAMASARSDIAIATKRLIPLSQHHMLAALPEEKRQEQDDDDDVDEENIAE